MSISILVLAAGALNFENTDGGYPLCLTEFDGVSLLERIIRNTRNISNSQYAFALLNIEAERFHLDKIVQLLAPGSSVTCTPESTKGSACTALLAASQLDPDSELLIISANELVDVDFQEIVSDFRHRGLRGGVLIFRSVHPRYSYVRLDSGGLVIEAAQQNPISQNATAGVFWFAKTREFIEAAMNLVRKNTNVNGNFYIAPTYNEIILNQGRVGVKDLDPAKYKPLKTERQVLQFDHRAPT
jgi:hypothetical protein